MDQEGREPAGVTRGQNVVYQLPHDWSSIAQLLTPTLDRVDEGARDLQLLVVTADAEGAAAAAAVLVRLAGGRAIDAVAATSAKRASRLLRSRPAPVVTGAPSELLGLIQGSALKLEHLRVVVLAWVDELLAHGDEADLATLMAEIPRDAARIIVASEITPEVEALVERYARRARRVVSPPGEPGTGAWRGLPLEYVTVSAVSRPPTLRRLLDDLDPARGSVYVRSDESEREASDLVRALGYDATDAEDAGADGVVRVVRGASSAGADVVVLYDIPASREELTEAVGTTARRVIALAQPRQLGSLRVLAGNAAAVPFTLSDAGKHARSREEAVRGELRAVLASGGFSRELLALEPLLDSYDGIEVAAAALRLLQQARLERDAARARPSEARGGDVGAPSMTRLFINVGAIDNARPGDLVGAITNEAGITSSQVGKIEIRENHSLVEVAADVAERVVSKLTGSLVRGRRAVVRLDQERPARQGSSRGRPGGSDRGDRSARGDRGTRGAPRGGGGSGHEGRGRPTGKQGDRGHRQQGNRPFVRRPEQGDRDDRAARPPRSGETE